jgi:hypothetical protein
MSCPTDIVLSFGGGITLGRPRHCSEDVLHCLDGKESRRAASVYLELAALLYCSCLGGVAQCLWCVDSARNWKGEVVDINGCDAVTFRSSCPGKRTNIALL